jgi:hypothetical protein
MKLPKLYSKILEEMFDLNNPSKRNYGINLCFLTHPDKNIAVNAFLQHGLWHSSEERFFTYCRKRIYNYLGKPDQKLVTNISPLILNMDEKTYGKNKRKRSNEVISDDEHMTNINNGPNHNESNDETEDETEDVDLPYAEEEEKKKDPDYEENEEIKETTRDPPAKKQCMRPSIERQPISSAISSLGSSSSSISSAVAISQPVMPSIVLPAVSLLSGPILPSKSSAFSAGIWKTYIAGSISRVTSDGQTINGAS